MIDMSLSQLKIPELKGRCKELGISGISKLNKPALIDRIKSKLSGTQSSASSFSCTTTAAAHPPSSNSHSSSSPSLPNDLAPVSPSQPTSFTSSFYRHPSRPLDDPSSTRDEDDSFASLASLRAHPSDPRFDPVLLTSDGATLSSADVPINPTAASFPADSDGTAAPVPKRKKRRLIEPEEGEQPLGEEQQPRQKTARRKLEADVLGKTLREGEMVSRGRDDAQDQVPHPYASSSLAHSPQTPAFESSTDTTLSTNSPIIGSSSGRPPSPPPKKRKPTKIPSAEDASSSSTDFASISPSSDPTDAPPTTSSSLSSFSVPAVPSSKLMTKAKPNRPMPPATNDEPSTSAPPQPPKKKSKPTDTGRPTSVVKPSVFKTPLLPSLAHTALSSSSAAHASNPKPSLNPSPAAPLATLASSTSRKPGTTSGSAARSLAAPKRKKKFVSPFVASIPTRPLSSISTRPSLSPYPPKHNLPPTLPSLTPISLPTIQSSWLARVYRTLHLSHPSSPPEFAFDSITQELYSAVEIDGNEALEVAMRFVLSRFGREVMLVGRGFEGVDEGCGLESGRDGGWGRVVAVEKVGGAGVWKVKVEGWEQQQGDKRRGKTGDGRKMESWLILGATGEPLGRAPPPSTSNALDLTNTSHIASSSFSTVSNTSSPNALRADWAAHTTSLISQRPLLSLVQTPNSAEFPSGISKRWWGNPTGGGNGTTEEGSIAERYVLSSCVLQGISGTYLNVRKQCDLFNGVPSSSSIASDFASVNQPREMAERVSVAEEEIQLFLPLSHQLLSLHLQTNLTASPTSPLVPLHPSLALVVKGEGHVECVLRETGQIVGAGEEGVSETWREVLGCTERGLAVVIEGGGGN